MRRLGGLRVCTGLLGNQQDRICTGLFAVLICQLDGSRILLLDVSFSLKGGFPCTLYFTEMCWWIDLLTVWFFIKMC
jgi:hypothetical protein